MPKVVQSLPGVSGSVGGFRNDVIIRGGGPSKNVYYLDGIEIPVINHFATEGSAGGPVGLLNVSFFEGVSLSTSSFPAKYDNVLSGGRFSTSLGIRADGNTFTEEGHKLWQTLSPRVAISYALDPDSRWRVNASVGRYYKIPPSTILGFKERQMEYLLSRVG